MLSRESLHKLIDTLPDGALESIERVLNNYQWWPPKPPVEVEKMRQRVEERFQKSMTFYIVAGTFKPDGDGRASMSTSDGPTLVSFKVQVFRAKDSKSKSAFAWRMTVNHCCSHHEATFEFTK